MIQHFRSTRFAFVRASAMFLALGLATASPLGADPPLQLVYQASFPNGSYDSSVDRLHLGALKKGDSQIANSYPTWNAAPGEVVMKITRPAGVPSTVAVSAGVFAQPVSFAAGSRLRLSATFVAPSGPLDIGGWAVAVSARTGGQNDLPTDTRATVTLQSRPNGIARLNVPFGSTAPTSVFLTAAVHKLIFGAHPKPFTIELSIDRVTGKGEASLKVENRVLSAGFNLSDFSAAPGSPVITAVGAAVANANAPGATVSVHLRDFRIYTDMHA